MYAHICIIMYMCVLLCAMIFSEYGINWDLYVGMWAYTYKGANFGDWIKPFQPSKVYPPKLQRACTLVFSANPMPGLIKVVFEKCVLNTHHWGKFAMLSQRKVLQEGNCLIIRANWRRKRQTNLYKVQVSWRKESRRFLLSEVPIRENQKAEPRWQPLRPSSRGGLQISWNKITSLKRNGFTGQLQCLSLTSDQCRKSLG